MGTRAQGHRIHRGRNQVRPRICKACRTPSGGRYRHVEVLLRTNERTKSPPASEFDEATERPTPPVKAMQANGYWQVPGQALAQQIAYSEQRSARFSGLSDQDNMKRLCPASRVYFVLSRKQGVAALPCLICRIHTPIHQLFHDKSLDLHPSPLFDK